MRDLPISVIVSLRSILTKGIKPVRDLGLSVCQLHCWEPDLYSAETAARVEAALGDEVAISSLWAGWPPPAAWNFVDGPLTLGLVPAAYRAERIRALKRGAEFATLLGLTDVTTHVGFIPENPSTTEYREVVIAVREVARYCRDLGLHFNFETGQETPITLLRIIQDVGLDNLGINLDPANLLLYGKANPVDAVGILGGLVRGVHVKDGLYPTNGRELGKETRVGEGGVDFPKLLARLVSFGYEGPLTIEREAGGAETENDIRQTVAYLRELLTQL